MDAMRKWPRRRLSTLCVIAALAAAALIVVGLAGCGSSTTTTPTSSPTQPTTAQSTATTPSTGTPGAPIVLTATGTSATGQFPLKSGLTVFDILYSGSGTFTVELLDAGGGAVTQLVNATGLLNGKQSYGVRAGKYSLQVNAGGNWTVTITQPTPVVLPYIPQVFAGENLDVTDYFSSPNGGLANVTLTNTGNGPFVVTLLNQAGQNVRVVVNANGPFNSSVQVPLVAATPYVFDVESDGAWTIRIE